MVLETPPPSSTSSLNGGQSTRVRPEALARKLRRLAGEALEKVGDGHWPPQPSGRVLLDVASRSERTHTYIQRLHARAAFYADKVVTLGQGATGGQGQGQQPLLPLSQQQRAEDVLLLAKAYHQGRDFRRAVHTLERHGLLAVKVGRGGVGKECLFDIHYI
jgi:hypothetical protein